jgi:hypothetical protein
MKLIIMELVISKMYPHLNTIFVLLQYYVVFRKESSEQRASST